jgi:hypothetical protein
MNRTITLSAAIALMVLSACSSGTRYSSANAARGPAPVVPVVYFATGPIYSACQRGGRRDASRQRCGCVQAVADGVLSADDQRRGAGFFSDPHLAQTVRQSDRSVDERFWTKWKAYSDQAARICT